MSRVTSVHISRNKSVTAVYTVGRTCQLSDTGLNVENGGGGSRLGGATRNRAAWRQRHLAGGEATVRHSTTLWRGVGRHTMTPAGSVTAPCPTPWRQPTRWFAAALGALLALGAGALVTASASTATVEVRVWQDVGNEHSIYVSARSEAGTWATLGTIPLLLDDGRSSSGRYRYGDLRLDVPLSDPSSPLTIEVRVWQHVTNSVRIYVSARPEEGDWGRLGTIPLPLDDGHSSSGRYRYGDLRLAVPLPPPIPDVSVEFGDDFSPEQRARYEAEIRSEFASVAGFFANRHQLAATGLTIRLTTDQPPTYGASIITLMQERTEPTIEEMRGGTMGVESPEWVFLSPLAHEYVHALQVEVLIEALGQQQPSTGWPYWIEEGMAWYLDALQEQARPQPPVADHFADPLASATYARHFFKSRDYLWWQARKSTESLQGMERSNNWNAYVGYLAIEQLVERSSEAALFDFYRHVATAPDWQTAFEDAFGLMVDAFYADFEAWRAEAVPLPSYYSGRVVGPDGNPVEGVVVQALRSVGGSMESIGSAPFSWRDRSEEDGTFRMPAEPGLAVLVVGTDTCGEIAFLSEVGGLTRDPGEARRHVIDLEGVSGIEVRLPRAPTDLCSPGDREWVASWAIRWPSEWTAWITWDYAGQFLPWNP